MRTTARVYQSVLALASFVTFALLFSVSMPAADNRGGFIRQAVAETAATPEVVSLRQALATADGQEREWISARLHALYQAAITRGAARARAEANRITDARLAQAEAERIRRAELEYLAWLIAQYR